MTQYCSTTFIARLDDRHTLTIRCSTRKFTLNMATTAMAEQVHRTRAHDSRAMSEFETRISYVKSEQPLKCEPLCEA